MDCVCQKPKQCFLFSKLSENKEIDKTYIAVIEGVPDEKAGVLEDLLFKDSAKNKSFVVKRMRKGVKKASLEYVVKETVECGEKNLSLVEIKLHTGRTHQIRVQFSSRKMPLCGDGKYGSKDNKCNVSLWSHKLCLKLFANTEESHFTSFPPKDAYPWNLFKYTGE
ncbi:MAG: RNA pseudouridine synthase [Ruminococcaceae bacterium]|nr:RNA pseudouridine synthase [Oscillospiraceae bacterium]